MLSSRHLVRVPGLIEGFPTYVAGFAQAPAFDRAGQLEHHLRTIALRNQAGSVAHALDDEDFVDALYSTLRAWGIGSRASKLLPLPEFRSVLRYKSEEIAAYEDIKIGDDFEPDSVSTGLWELIENLGIVDNNTQIVSGTKTLHHLLPGLVVPFDRKYTQSFFNWGNPEVQYGQSARFKESFSVFHRVAQAVTPTAYVGGGWNSSPTKVIDNAIIGMLRAEAVSA